MATPAGVVITATRPDGTAIDITEGVQALYDIVIQSLDWGSGFLTVEEAEPIAQLAEVCGFRDLEEAQKYVRRARKVERTERERRERHYGPLPVMGSSAIIGPN